MKGRWKMSKNFYEILNIEIGASPDEIKKAYRNMANKFHPDKIKNEEQKEKRTSQDNT